MTEEQAQESAAEPAGKATKSVITRSRMIAAGTALGGMIVGSVVGIGVQMGVESTGLLGPSVEALIADQSANFQDVNTKLDAIRSMSDDPQLRQSLAELERLLARQDELGRRATAELGYLGDQVDALKEQQLAESGYAGGADFWLKSGESVSVGGASHVFGVISARGTIVDVNLSGTRKRLTVGDALSVPGDAQGCTIFYKQATPRPDGRVGFDLTCG